MRTAGIFAEMPGTGGIAYSYLEHEGGGFIVVLSEGDREMPTLSLHH